MACQVDGERERSTESQCCQVQLGRNITCRLQCILQVGTTVCRCGILHLSVEIIKQ
jgi:hypothetical protein